MTRGQLTLAFCSSSPRRLDRLALCELVLSAEKKPPEWVELVPAGKLVKALDGREWTNTAPEKIVERFNDDPREIPIDWEHATEIKAPEGEPAPAAGWITEMEIRNGAVWGRCEWTPNGTESIVSRAYRYFSPAFLFSKAGEISKIISAALTNRPALDMPALAHEVALCIIEKRDGEWLVLSESGDVIGEHDTEADAQKQLNAIEASKHSKQKSGAPAQEITMEPKLLALLDLAADATIDQVLAAIAQLKDTSAKAAAELKTSKDELATARASNPSLDKFVPRPDYELALARATAAEKQITDEKKAAHDKAVADAIDEAVKLGKVAPASKDFYLSTCSMDGGLEKFKIFIASAPVIAAPSNLDDKGQPASGGVSIATAEELKISGMSKEDYLKAKAQFVSAAAA